ncbi:hypothetical protein HYPSUDRAFT_57652 [Hypholoma sublateritium FD-334 SS-4]|uniref:MYND-type domain-containing protein n=1 Tax=Hypholoma sublateritium (strain FD-334 SS-4) TaxID=945553 RepID=A0A0D2NF47_HYPSF|nr:hypothetical protein HYPSUDRAFT_57652 [Hypholoma sublateritium FD-334 SS-4]
MPPLAPVAQHLKQCQNCFKSESDETHLQCCSYCKRAHYCSKECQKADWKAHKAQCSQNRETRKAMKAAPELPSTALKEFSNAALEVLTKNWVQQYRPLLSITALHALELKRTPARSLTHILVVYLSFAQKAFASAPPPDSETVRRAFTLADAHVTLLADILPDISSHLRPGLQSTFDAIARRTLTLRAADPGAVGFALALLVVRECSLVRLVPLGADMHHKELPTWDPAWKETFAKCIERGNVF